MPWRREWLGQDGAGVDTALNTRHGFMEYIFSGPVAAIPTEARE